MRATLVLGLLCLGACTPDTQVFVWDPLEPEEVSAALTEPSAALDEALIAGATATLEQRLVGVFEHSRLFADVVDGLGEAAGVDATSDAGAPTDVANEDEEVDFAAGSGTRVFLSLGCPGAGQIPDYNTDNGVLRIDSGLLDSPDPRALLNGGSLRFAFIDCQLGALQVNGTIPVALGLDAQALDLPVDTLPTSSDELVLAADLSSLQVADSELRIGVVAIGCAGYGSCGDDYQVAVEVIDTHVGSLVISFGLERAYWQDRGSRTLTLHAANRTVECSYNLDAQKLDCTFDAP